MRIEFSQDLYMINQLTPAKIVEEIETVGFGAELLEMIENNQVALMNKNDVGNFDDLEMGDDNDNYDE